MPRDCAINLDHIQTVSKGRVGALITTLSSEKMIHIYVSCKGVGVLWAQSMATLLAHGQLAEVPGAGGYVQHSAPRQCVDIWRNFARESR